MEELYVNPNGVVYSGQDMDGSYTKIFPIGYPHVFYTLTRLHGNFPRPLETDILKYKEYEEKRYIEYGEKKKTRLKINAYVLHQSMSIGIGEAVFFWGLQFYNISKSV